MRGQKKLSHFFLNFSFLIFVKSIFVRTFLSFFLFLFCSFFSQQKDEKAEDEDEDKKNMRDGDARGGEQRTSTGCKGPKAGLGQASK